MTEESVLEHELQDQLDLDIVKKRSISGVIAITSRTFFLQGLAIIANFLFGFFLLPQEYGVFFGVSAVIEFFVIFSDVGLAAALIQKKEPLTQKDLRTTFTVQQILVNSLVIIALLLSGSIAQFYNLSNQGLWLFRALAISLTLASLKTIPSIKLERSLKFSKLVIPQVIENIFFYVTAVFLAWKGFGVSSFTWAVLLRGSTGLIAIYILSPWMPSFSIDKKVIKKLFSFGFPFQLNTVIAFVKDKLIVAYLFKVLTATEVGFIGFAQKWSQYPLQLIMNSINKVTFPTYSRIQHQRQVLKKAVEKSLFFVSFLTFPMIIGMVAISPAFIRLVPRYQKWEPALIALAFFAINSMWSSISTTLTNTFASVGKIKLNLKLMVMWTTLTWILTPLLIFKFGYNGAAIASAIVAFTSIFPIILIRRIVKGVKVISNTVPSLLSALAVGAVAYIFSHEAESLISLLIIIFLSGILYLLLSWVMQGKKLRKEAKLVINIIRNRD